MAEKTELEQIEEQDKMIEAAEDMVEELGEILSPKMEAKDLVKLFASGFVGGCSGALVQMWLKGFPGLTGTAMGKAGAVIDEVGRFGLAFAVESKVTSEVNGTLDAIDHFISLKATKAKAEKALLKAKKEQSKRKEKYIEVKEG